MKTKRRKPILVCRSGEIILVKAQQPSDQPAMSCSVYAFALLSHFGQPYGFPPLFQKSIAHLLHQNFSCSTEWNRRRQPCNKSFDNIKLVGNALWAWALAFTFFMSFEGSSYWFIYLNRGRIFLRENSNGLKVVRRIRRKIRALSCFWKSRYNLIYE